MIKRIVFFIYMYMSVAAYAQESNSVFNFMELPVSAHSTALGGHNISVIEDDATLIFANPALLASVSDKTISLNYMTYLQGCHVGSAAFTKILSQRSTLGITAQFANYGKMEETTVENVVTGIFTPTDLAISGMYAYNLSERWAGGATGKFIYSHYGSFSSIALAVDLGLNYYDEETDLSLSFVARNLGGQLKAFGDTHEKLPYSLQAGFSKRFNHAPFRVSVTLVDLTRWSKDYYYSLEDEMSTGKIIMNHLTLGVDYLPTDNMYIALGYNFRKANEMKALGSSHAAGLCVGAGIHLSRFRFGIAYAQYHLSAPSLVFNAAYNL